MRFRWRTAQTVNRRIASWMALRLGAADVLDMEVEDLQLLAVGQPGGREVALLLYDPMPGGSGLLDQMKECWAGSRRRSKDRSGRLVRLFASQRAWIVCSTSGIPTTTGTSTGIQP